MLLMEKEIEMINRIIVEAVMHGADSGGSYDSGYCYVLARPLTDEEDDMCEDCCCAKKINKEDNTYMNDIYYIVGIRNDCTHNLNLTTINKEFCGKFIRQSHGNLYFELNGSKALVIVPEEWISYCAPSKVLWGIHKEDFKR